MMNPTKRLEQLQKRFEATSVEEAVAKMAISEALQRIDLEDIDLIMSGCRSADEATPEQKAALNRYLAAYAAATVRLTTVPPAAPIASKKGPHGWKQSRGGLLRETHLKSEKARRSFLEFVEQGTSWNRPCHSFPASMWKPCARTCRRLLRGGFGTSLSTYRRATRNRSSRRCFGRPGPGSTIPKSAGSSPPIGRI